MKTNKKALLVFAVAMVFSLAFMQGNTIKTNKQDVNVQQISGVAAYVAGSSEGGTSSTAAYVAGVAGGYATTVGGGLAYTWFVSGTNPAGWVAWGSVAGAAL